MMVREASIGFTVQWHDLASQSFQQAWADHAGDTVTAVDDNLERLCEGYVGGDFIDVSRHAVFRGHAAGTVGEAALANTLANCRDSPARQCLPADHDLEPVVVRCIVAAGDDDAGADASSLCRVVQDRRGYIAKIDNVDTCLRDAFDECAFQNRGALAAVARDRERRLTGLCDDAANGAADESGVHLIQLAAHDPADVVVPEDDVRRKIGFIDIPVCSSVCRRVLDLEKGIQRVLFKVVFDDGRSINVLYVCLCFT